MERAYPGAIIVNSKGRRFTNEAASYVDVVHAMYEGNSESAGFVPSFMIMDRRFRSRFMLGTMAPGRVPKEYLESGYVIRGDTIEELAKKTDVDGISPVS